MIHSPTKKGFTHTHTSTSARVLRLGDNVGLTPLAANTSSGVLQVNKWGILISKPIYWEMIINLFVKKKYQKCKPC